MRWLLMAGVLAWGTGASGASRIVLYPLASERVPLPVMLRIEAALQSELARIKGTAVVKTPEAKANPCADGDLRCLAEYGKAARADEVLFGKLEMISTYYSLSLRVLDVRRVQASPEDAQAVDPDVDELVRVAQGQLFKLKDPARYAGRFVFHAPAGAVIRINGAQIDPRKPQDVPPGRYTVSAEIQRADRTGFSEGSADTELRFGHQVDVDVTANNAVPSFRDEAFRRMPSAVAIASAIKPTPPKQDPPKAEGPAPEAAQPQEKRAEAGPQGAATSQAPLLAPPIAGEGLTASAPEHTPIEPAWMRYARWSLMGAGLAAAAVGAGFEISAYATRSDLNGMKTASGNFRWSQATTASILSRADTASTRRTMGWCFIGGGLAATAAGAVWTWRAPPSTSVHTTIALQGGGAALVVTGSFR